MRNFLNRENQGFPPEAVEQLVRIFDDAWSLCVANGQVTEANREEMQEALARRLVELSSQGDYDAESLRDAAISSLGLGKSGVKVA